MEIRAKECLSVCRSVWVQHALALAPVTWVPCQPRTPSAGNGILTLSVSGRGGGGGHVGGRDELDEGEEARLTRCAAGGRGGDGQRGEGGVVVFPSRVDLNRRGASGGIEFCSN